MTTGVAFENPLEAIAEPKSSSLVLSTTTTISSSAKECLRGHDALRKILGEISEDAAAANGFCRDDVIIKVQDARSRYKAWATNIAALQEGHLKSSLEFRLREALEIRSRVLKILESLEESLHEAELIVTGVRGNKTWDLGAMSDSSFTSEDGSELSSDESDGGSMNEKLETSELDEFLSAIKTANSSLMDISIVIRNTPTRDDYVKAAARHTLDPHWDINHVDAKFGAAKRSSDWLIQRLGKSITRRRQYLTYRKEHHEKLSKDWDMPARIGTVLKDDQGKEETRPSTLALTKATTYVEALPAAPKDGSEVGSFETETSYQQTVAGETEEHLLTVPPPPTEAFEGVPFEFGHPFQCPYCWTEQNVKGRNAWKKHVFRDLRPYVCTFKECNLRMFRSRNEWFAHELQAHRREWTCATCSKLFSSKSSFKTHLLSHDPTLAGSELDAQILQSEEPMDRFPASACSFCNEWEEQIMDPKQNEKRAFLNEGKDVAPYGTKTHFRRHLGRHMEQLALFALPRNNLDDVDDDSDREIRGEVNDDDSDASTGTTVSEHTSHVVSSTDVLRNEISEIEDEFPGTTLEITVHGFGPVALRGSLEGPWGKDYRVVPIVFMITFEDEQLNMNTAIFNFEDLFVENLNDGEPLSVEAHGIVTQEVSKIIQSLSSSRKSCLSAIVIFLLGGTDIRTKRLGYEQETTALAVDDSSPQGHEAPRNRLQDEIQQAQRERPELIFDTIDMATRHLVVTYKLPARYNDPNSSIRVELIFPDDYPYSKAPDVLVTSLIWSPTSITEEIGALLERELERDLDELMRPYATLRRRCLRHALLYIATGDYLKKYIPGPSEATTTDDGALGERDSVGFDEDEKSLVIVASDDLSAAQSRHRLEVLQDEVASVRDNLPHAVIELAEDGVSMSAFLTKSWGAIRLNIRFPTGYPDSELPSFQCLYSWDPEHSSASDESTEKVHKIAKEYLARKSGCLEAVLDYLNNLLKDHTSPSAMSSQKRRASSPPGDDGQAQDITRNARDLYREREVTLQASPVPQFHSIENIHIPGLRQEGFNSTSKAAERKIYVKCCQCENVSHPQSCAGRICPSCTHDWCITCTPVGASAIGSQLTSHYLPAETNPETEDVQQRYPKPQIDSVPDSEDKESLATQRPSRHILIGSPGGANSSSIVVHDTYSSMSSNETIQNTSTIFIENTVFLTVNKLVSLFTRFGLLAGIYKPKDRNIAYLKFVHRHDAQKAIEEMVGHVVDGLSLNVDFAYVDPAKRSDLDVLPDTSLDDISLPEEKNPAVSNTTMSRTEPASDKAESYLEARPGANEQSAAETTRRLAAEAAAWEQRLKEEREAGVAKGIENAKKAAEAERKKAEEKAATSRPQKWRKTYISVLGVPETTTLSELREHFKAFGKIRYTRELRPLLRVDIEYADHREARAALGGMNGKIIGGNVITVKLGEPVLVRAGSDGENLDDAEQKSGWSIAESPDVASRRENSTPPISQVSTVPDIETAVSQSELRNSSFARSFQDGYKDFKELNRGKQLSESALPFPQDLARSRSSAEKSFEIENEVDRLKREVDEEKMRLVDEKRAIAKISSASSSLHKQRKDRILERLPDNSTGRGVKYIDHEIDRLDKEVNEGKLSLVDEKAALERISALYRLRKRYTGQTKPEVVVPDRGASDLTRERDHIDGSWADRQGLGKQSRGYPTSTSNVPEEIDWGLLDLLQDGRSDHSDDFSIEKLSDIQVEHISPNEEHPEDQNKDSTHSRRAERKAEIKRRALLLDPPIPAPVLAHMPAYQAAIGSSTPLSEIEWKELKLKLVSQRNRLKLGLDEKISGDASQEPKRSARNSDSPVTSNTEVEFNRLAAQAEPHVSLNVRVLEDQDVSLPHNDKDEVFSESWAARLEEDKRDFEYELQIEIQKALDKNDAMLLEIGYQNVRIEDCVEQVKFDRADALNMYEIFCQSTVEPNLELHLKPHRKILLSGFRDAQDAFRKKIRADHRAALDKKAGAASDSQSTTTSQEAPENYKDGHTAQEWESIREPFLNLYNRPDLTFLEVKTILEEDHGFFTTDRLLREKRNQWLPYSLLEALGGESPESQQTSPPPETDGSSRERGASEVDIQLEQQAGREADATSSLSSEQQPHSSTSDINDRAAWNAELRKMMMSWTAKFDIEILEARDRILLPLKSRFEEHINGVESTMMQAWNQQASKSQETYVRTYESLLNSAMQASRKLRLSEADKASWRSQLDELAHQIRGNLMNDLKAFESEIEGDFGKMLLEVTENSEAWAAWSFKLDKQRAFWFGEFEQMVKEAEIPYLSETMQASGFVRVELGKSGIWQNEFHELLARACETCREVYDSAMMADKSKLLKDSDKSFWEDRLQTVGARERVSLRAKLETLEVKLSSMNAQGRLAKDQEQTGKQDQIDQLVNEQATEPGMIPEISKGKAQAIIEHSNPALAIGTTAGSFEIHPPCDTLAVTNLPFDITEYSVKQLFTKQPGFKRMMLRHKDTQPEQICLLQFDDIASATHALHELDGIHSSDRGNIRLAFAKNALGMRSVQEEDGNDEPETSDLPAAPSLDSQTRKEKAPGPLSFTLTVILHIAGARQTLNFANTTTTMTLGELKIRIRDALPSKPSVERQLLVYEGRIIIRDTETMLEIIGQENLSTTKSPTLQLVVGLNDPEPASYPSTSIPAPVSQEAETSRNNDPWTPAEEQKLKTMRDRGDSWGTIAKRFPNRSAGSLKKHYYKEMTPADFAAANKAVTKLEKATTPSDEEITEAIYEAVLFIQSTKPDKLNVRKARKRVEAVLRLESGFLSGEAWKERSQKIFTDYTTLIPNRIEASEGSGSRPEAAPWQATETPSNAHIIEAIYDAIDLLQTTEPDKLNMRNVRKRVEEVMKLESGFLSSETWKEQSQDIFKFHIREPVDATGNLREASASNPGTERSEARAPSENDIFNGIYAAIEELSSTDQEQFTVNTVRNKAEADMGLKPGFLSNEKWRAKTKRWIHAMQDELPVGAEDDDDLPLRISEGTHTETATKSRSERSEPAGVLSDYRTGEDFNREVVEDVNVGGHLTPTDIQQDQRLDRRFEEGVQRLYKCGWNGCDKAFETADVLYTHRKTDSHQSLQAIPQAAPGAIEESLAVRWLRIGKEEADILEREFQKNSRPTTETKRQIAEKMGIKPRRIHYWFKYRQVKRAEEKN